MAYEKQFWEEQYNNSGEEERLERELKKAKALNKDLLEACEAMIRLKDLIAYKEPVKPEHEGEAQAISAALLKIKLAINKAKGI